MAGRRVKGKGKGKRRGTAGRGRRGGRKDRRWIQRAIKRPGALKKWLKRNEKKIEKLTGEKPFTKSGEVNTKALRELRKTEWYEHLSTKTKQRINLAITLEKFHKG